MPTDHASAVQKCIDNGIAETPQLESWYKENCDGWIKILENVDTAIEDYNDELPAGESPIKLLASFGDGNAMFIDSQEALTKGPPGTGDDLDMLMGIVGPEGSLYKEADRKAAELASKLEAADKYSDAVKNPGFFGRLVGLKKGHVLGQLEGDPLGRSDEEIIAAYEALKEKLINIAKGDLEALAAAESVPYERIVYAEQCFLLAKIFDLVAHKKEGIEAVSGKLIPYITPGGISACHQVEGDPFDFTNVMTQNSILGALHNMETEELASLQPQIRLYKIREDKEGNEYQQEFKFDAYATATDVESVFKDKNKRGFGAGIKKFSFTYDGSNFFAAKKSIKATLQIFANNFGELLTDRGGYRYTDLTMHTGKGVALKDVCGDFQELSTGSEAAANLEALNFRLKAVIGWAYPSGDTSLFTSRGYSASEKNTILDAISESYVTLNLLPTVHDFAIDDQGRVNFTINYRAYVDTFFNEPYFNIFYDPAATQGLMRRKLLYDALKQECTAEELAAIKRRDAESGRAAGEKALNVKSLLSRLEGESAGRRSQIHYIGLSYDELKSFQTAGPYFESSEESIEVKNASDAVGGVSEELVDQYMSHLSNTQTTTSGTRESIKIALDANNPTWNYLSFFYVSDLVDVVLTSIEEYLKDYSDGGPALDELKGGADMEHVEECQYEIEKTAVTKFYKNFKRYRVILGPLEIIDPRDNGQAQYISLGDIPVSVKYFIQWLNEKMTNFDTSTYFLSQFLTDFFNDLISNFLNDASCFTFNTKQKISLNQTVFTSYPEQHPELPGTDEITQYLIEQMMAGGTDLSKSSRVYLEQAKLLGRPLLNISGPRGSRRVAGNIQEEINYLAFSAGRVASSRPLTGNKKEDEKAGIFHYMLGRPRGIVKNIKLQKTSAKGLPAVRWEQDGYDGLQQLRPVYDITVESYANVRTFPGTYIFVDPRGWDPSTTLSPDDIMNISRYGIGGYCMIRLSEHSFGPGEATTTLHTNWVQEIGSTTNPLGVAKVSGDGSSPDICTQNEKPTPKANLGRSLGDTIGDVVGDIKNFADNVAEDISAEGLRNVLDRIVDKVGFGSFNDSVGSSEYPGAGPGQGGTQTGVD